jgi:hypothetical protein
MTLHSSGLFSVRTASGCIDNVMALPVSPSLPDEKTLASVSPSLPDEKTLAFVATTHFVRGSKLFFCWP